MRKEISFLYSLSPALQDRIRVIAVREKGDITSFMVQYEAVIREMWREVVRYDTWHGFAHKDVMHPDGTKEKLMLSFPDFNTAFTFAITDLKASCKLYRARYEKEMGS